jgi:CRP-like cAMP-binding protein
MIEPMPDLEEKAETFANVGAGSPNADVLVIPGWAKPEWRTLFSYATEQALAAGETLIQQQEAGRTLYFVVAGVLQAEVSPHSGAAPSYGGPPVPPLRILQPGSVVGEVAFFDGWPRSARIWAVEDSQLMRLEVPAYDRFAAEHLQQANELLFALGRLVALRLRQSTARATRLQ